MKLVYFLYVLYFPWWFKLKEEHIKLLINWLLSNQPAYLSLFSYFYIDSILPPIIFGNDTVQKIGLIM